MNKSKSALFLMELIIVIFFFTLTSAVCLRVFVKAHDTAVETGNLNLAVLWAENAGECFNEFGADETAIRQVLDPEFKNEGYAYDLKFSEDSEYSYMDFTFNDTVRNRTIYSFQFKQHKQREAN
ncbi:MAG: hypothetical protein K6E19_04680 [Lachnospiraceae bacterium]|nr:hypothetical protein [Lachnospiraceae bacterium]